MKTITLYGKQVGSVNGGVYYTHRTPATFFRKFQGFGLSEEIIRQLEGMGVKDVTIVYKNKEGKKRVYDSTLHQWKESPLTYTDEREDVPIDRQKILRVKEMVE